MLELCRLPPLLGQLIQHRLKSLSPASLMTAIGQGGVAFTMEPEHFTAEMAIKALLGDEFWFDHAKELAFRGISDYKQQAYVVAKAVAFELSRGTSTDLEQLIANNP